MGMQITVDPSGLTQQQKEAIAGFILAYPDDNQIQTIGNLKDRLAGINLDLQKPIAPEDNPSAGTNVHAPSALPSHELSAQQAFGASTPPLPVGAIPAAPSIAAVGQFSIAPEGELVTLVPSPPSVPAPPAAMPVNTAVPAAPLTANLVPGVELDSKGLPWDKRIHADSRAKVADGSWRKKKQLDPVLLATVEAELRGVMAAPAAPAAPFVPPPPAAVAVPAPSVTTPPASPPAAPTAAGADAVTIARNQFVVLVGKASTAMQANKITQGEITQVCQKFGVQALPLLANRLDLVASVSAEIDALIASRG